MAGGRRTSWLGRLLVDAACLAMVGLPILLLRSVCLYTQIRLSNQKYQL